MKEEFNLSDKMKFAYSEDGFVNGLDVIPIQDVKEFIKKLKERINLATFNKISRKKNRIDTILFIYNEIDKLAGDKLC